MQVVRIFHCKWTSEVVATLGYDLLAGGDRNYFLDVNPGAQLRQLHNWLDSFSLEVQSSRGYKDMRAVFEKALLRNPSTVHQDRDVSNVKPHWVSFLEACQ